MHARSHVRTIIIREDTDSNPMNLLFEVQQAWSAGRLLPWESNHSAGCILILVMNRIAKKSGNKNV